MPQSVSEPYSIQDKKVLRRTVLRQRRALSAAEKAGLDAAVLRQLLTLLPTLSADRPLFCYVGAGFEVATRTFLSACFNAGIPVCVPLCTGSGIMEARLLHSMQELVPGAYDLPEPPPSSRLIPPDALGTVIVPGLAFDAQGYRLGRGGGFYDRYLTQLPDATPVYGLCYRSFIRILPRDMHDRPVGSIITEEGVIPCS